jgi:Family of unknown function (DUF6228)
MRVVQVGVGACLRLTPDDISPGKPQYVLAELRCDGLTASRRVVHNYASGFTDLADFFDQLAKDWRGWTAVRLWESVEHDLRIEARHEYGHVQLRISIRREGPGWGNEGWQATADVTIEPGEQLSQIAADLRSLANGRT